MLSVHDPVHLVRTDEAMACRVRVQVNYVGDAGAIEHAVGEALAAFHDVDRTCTRFDPDSDLMRANTTSDDWVAVAPYCFDALVEAHWAYRRTGGRFDPRVLDDLVRLGYDRSLRDGPPSERSAAALCPRPTLPAWRPEFRRDTREVRLGGQPVDLGGIGKGLAVRWAADKFRDVDCGFMVEAGGDCACRGMASNGEPWRVGVEDPNDPRRHVAVLSLSDAAIATSSVRIRQWAIAGRPVHHLIDPSTGLPGGDGLVAVTVVDADPATAEVWSKVLFLAGARGVRTSAEHHGIAALWVTADGLVAWSGPLADMLVWAATP